MESVLLRRRKLLRWNKGARFHILPGKPSHEELLQALADEEHAANQTLEHQRQHSMNVQQSRLPTPPASPPQNNNNDSSSSSNASGAQQDDAASTAAAVAAAAERVYATVASVAAGRTSPSSQSSSSSPTQAHYQEDSTEALAALLPFWSEQLPEPWEFGELDFDLRRVAKVLGPRSTFLHVAHRLGRRFRYLRPSNTDRNVGVEGGPTTTPADDTLSASSQQPQQPQRRRSSLRPTLKGEYMCDASTFGRWAEAVADSYSEANPYHNALHAADVMLTASVN